MPRDIIEMLERQDANALQAKLLRTHGYFASASEQLSYIISVTKSGGCLLVESS